MEDDILQELIAATLRLRDDCFWLHLLTENLMWASCEGFVQSSVLGGVQPGEPAVHGRASAF